MLDAAWMMRKSSLFSSTLPALRVRGGMRVDENSDLELYVKACISCRRERDLGQNGEAEDSNSNDGK